LPRPVQPELPIWVTTAAILTLIAKPASLARMSSLTCWVIGRRSGRKIAIYRQARAAAGHDPATGRVTLMLHTFVGDDDGAVRELVRRPMKEYLRSSIKLMLTFAWSFAAFKRPGGGAVKPEDVDLGSLPESEIDAILDFAFERYFETAGFSARHRPARGWCSAASARVSTRSPACWISGCRPSESWRACRT